MLSFASSTPERPHEAIEMECPARVLHSINKPLTGPLELSYALRTIATSSSPLADASIICRTRDYSQWQPKQISSDNYLPSECRPNSVAPYVGRESSIVRRHEVIEHKRFGIRHGRDAAHVLGAGMVAQDAGLELISIRPTAHQSVHTRCVQDFMHEVIGAFRELGQRREERSVA